MEIKFERDNAIRHDTKGKITEPFTVYLYEAVKLTFKTGIELLKNGKKIHQRKSTTTPNL